MKTRGFDIKRVGIAEGPFEKRSIAAIIAALSILQSVRERDGRNNRPLEDFFQPDEHPALEAVCRKLEGKTARQRNPHKKGSLAYASWVCARPMVSWGDGPAIKGNRDPLSCCGACTD